MSDKIYTMILLRRRFCKRLFLIACVFAISFFISVLIFGDLKSPRIMNLTNLNRCPACYGVTICPELYSNQIIFESYGWSNLFNAKNIYYGYTLTNNKVVLKKLAHDWELNEFDSKLCERWKQKKSCKPQDLSNVSNIDEHIMDIVHFNVSWPDETPRKGLVMCPYAYSFVDFMQNTLQAPGPNFSILKLHIWTMLMINPEPIILQVLKKSKGWPVPAYGGACGRLAVMTYEGEPLSSVTNIKWHQKLKHAKYILNAALDLTFKHERYRFYLLDWSLDNLVAKEDGKIAFVDLEDIIVLDKHSTPQKHLPNWYQRYTRENFGPGFTFSIENMCKHHLSDHNIWAACYILANEDVGYLYPIPFKVNSSRPHFDRLLSECLNGDNRFRTVSKLLELISDMLHDKKIVSNNDIV